MANNKLTPNLSLSAIAVKYDVNARGIDALQKAIEAGELNDMLRACAEERFGGDLKPVMAQFNRNLSSQRCTRKITDTASKNRADMVEALWAMTHSTQGGTSERAPKAGFQYTRAEVDALVVKGDVAELQRMYNNIHSNVNKALSGLSTSCYAEELAGNPKLARWVDVKEYVSEQLRTLKAATKAAAKTKQPKVELSEDLAKKLAGYQAGKKASFTAEQMAELIELVKTLG